MLCFVKMAGKHIGFLFTLVCFQIMRKTLFVLGKNRGFNVSLKSYNDNTYISYFRPFFTYWVTFVQVVIFIVAVAVYGIAPIGSSETEYSEAVGVTDLQIKMVLRTILIRIFVTKIYYDLLIELLQQHSFNAWSQGVFYADILCYHILCGALIVSGLHRLAFH